jgi:uncharacterized MAPEG superfamily protein
MSTAYWCVLIAALLPYVWIGFAKGGAADYNNKDPRGWMAKQQSYRVRNANSAHLNAFEAFPPFAIAVLMAQFTQVDAQLVAWLAMAFIALRILHGAFYLAGLHRFRSLVWVSGLSCVIALMMLSALRIGG